MNTASGNKKSSARSRRTGAARLARLSAKELLEILRDRRTIITLVLMPLLVYPLLGIIVQKFMLNSLASIEQPRYLIGVNGPQQMEGFERLMAAGANALARDEQRKLAKSDGQDPGTESDQSNGASASESKNSNQSDTKAAVENLLKKQSKPLAFLRDVAELNQTMEELVASGEIDVGVRLKSTDEVKNPKGQVVFKTSNLEFITRDGSTHSSDALKYVTERIDAWNLQWTRGAVRRATGLQLQLPYQFDEIKIASDDNGPPVLLTFVPLMLVLMTMTGAVYPAIDLTAGERERGTMEILIAAPVHRMALLFGKFIAVLAVAMLTAVVNMVAMMITVYTLGLDSAFFGEDGISYSVMALIFVLLLVFAGFFSAVLLGLTSFARSFKEAQAYLIPIMLMALAPGLLSLMPELKMNLALAATPLLNIVLLGRDLISGQVDLVMIAITFISTVLYGLLALGMAARVFGADSVLFGGSTSWYDFFHRSAEKLPVASMPTAMLFLAVLFPAFIVVGGLASRGEVDISTRLLRNAGVTFGLFVLLPLAFSQFFHLKKQSTFLLYTPRSMAVLAAVLLGTSVWTVAYEIEVFSLTGDRLRALKEIFESMKYELQEIPLALKLFCLALMPAVCEEFTFRGFLFSAFEKHFAPATTILFTAILFGLFHVFVRDALMFERMIPSTMMGLLLGYVCYRTGSVIPGMLLHTVHNGLLISLAHYEPQLQEWGIGVTEQKHLPITWLLTAAVPIVIGLVLLATRLVKSKLR